MTAVTPFAGRFGWHLRALGFNPLVRFTDRLEVGAVLAVLILALISIPAMAQAGQAIYSASVRTAETQTQTRHPLQAEVTDGTNLMTDFDGPGYVTVRWNDGPQQRTAQVVSRGAVKAGDRMTIWLDDTTRKVVAAPQTAADAKITALAAAGILWMTIVAFGALAAFAVRVALDRVRARAWERELQLFAHNDDGWANRRG